MIRFIGRKQELTFLEEKYSTHTPELIIVYGRRRIGKTTILTKSIEAKKEAIYYMVRNGDYAIELLDLTQEIQKQLNVYVPECKSFLELFTYIKAKIPNLIIIIDEFPYLIEKDKGIVKEFQKIWDTELKDSSIKIVLCGSAISVMEQELLEYNSPLYGRKTAQIQLKEFSFEELKLFFPTLENGELVKVYATFGGVPFYLEQYDQKKSYSENITTLFLKNTARFYEEGETLLKQELREPEVYFRILNAIFKGTTKVSQIAQKSYVDITNIHKYLKRLELMKIIQKKVPLTYEHEKLALYIISDKFFRFYMEVIYPNKNAIEMNRTEDILNSLKILKSYSITFEEIAREICSKIYPSIQKIGNYWYKETEIDIIGINETKRELLLGECKFETEKMGPEILKKLEEKAKNVGWNKNDRSVQFILVAKEGFKEQLVNISKQRKDIKLLQITEF